MRKLTIHTSPPKGWKEWCNAHHSFFMHPRWLDTIERGFDARTIYIFEPEQSLVCCISIFFVGPFKIGYLCFPCGLEGAGCLLDQKQLHALSNDLKKYIDALALAWPTGQKFVKGRISSLNIETEIHDLQKWRLPNTKRMRRLHNRWVKYQTSPWFELKEQGHKCDAQTFMELYQATLTRHQGNVKYTEQYFEALLEMNQELDQAKLLISTSADTVSGFIFVVYDGPKAYYLHGCQDLTYKKENANDLMFYQQILNAQNAGLDRFNMMSSPATQPTLIQFKEKWGGVSTTKMTTQLDIHTIKGPAFSLAKRVYYSSLARKIQTLQSLKHRF